MLSNVEFYNTPSGDVMVKKYGQPVRELTVNDRDIIDAVLSIIKDRYPEAFASLSDIYSKYDRNRINYEFKMVHRFIRCNLGEYDQYKYDIDHNGTICFEEVRCPLRGECQNECVICKPVLNTNLTEREKEILALIAQGLQAPVIAKELSLSVATINRHKENIKAKLMLKTVGEMVNFWHQNFNH